MRTVFSAVAGIAAIVLLAVAGPALWLDRHVVQEDGLVALAGPLGADPEFQAELADAAAETVLADAGFDPGLTELVRPLVEGAAEALTEHPGYPQAWTESLRRSHALTFSEGTLTLDIEPLVALVTEDAAEAIGTDIPLPPQVLVDIGQSDQGRTIDLLQNYAGLGIPFAVGSAMAAALALLVARRRSTTLVLLGLGTAISAALWKLASEYAVRQLESSTDANAIAGLFKEHLATAVEAGFSNWIVAAAGAGAVLVLVGLVSRIFAGSRT